MAQYGNVNRVIHFLIFRTFDLRLGVVADLSNTRNKNDRIKELKNILIKLNISPIITTKGARHTYGSYLWHRQIDLGVIAKILGHKDISMLVEVYGHTLQEKINDEFENIRKLLK